MPRRLQNHLDDSHKKDGGEGDGARHGRVLTDPEARQAGVPQQRKGGRQQVHKRRGQQDAGAKVAHGEEEAGGEPQARDARGHNRKCACPKRHAQDDEQRADVQRRVVLLLGEEAARRAGRPLAERDNIGVAGVGGDGGRVWSC